MIFDIDYDFDKKREIRDFLKKKIYDDFLYKTKEFKKVYSVASKKYRTLNFVKTVIYFYRKYPFLRLKFHKKQWHYLYEVFIKKREFVVLKGGNKSGKTYVLIVSALYFALFKKGAKIWVVLVDYNLGNDVVIDRIRKITGDQFKIGKDNVLEFLNSSRIVFKSNESNVEAFQSASVDAIFFDELPREDVFKECYARTIDTKGQICMTYTPIKLDWMYEKFYQNKIWSDDTYAIIEMSTLQNEFLKDNSKLLKIKEMSEDEYLSRVYGKYTSSEYYILPPPEINSCIASAKDKFSVAIINNDVVLTSFMENVATVEIYGSSSMISFVGVDIGSGIGRDKSVAIAYSQTGKLLWCLYSSNDNISDFIKKLMFIVNKYSPNSIIYYEKNGIGVAFFEIIRDKFRQIYEVGRITGVNVSKKFKTENLFILKGLLMSQSISIPEGLATELNFCYVSHGDIHIKKGDDFLSAILLIIQHLSPQYKIDENKSEKIDNTYREYSLF